MIYSRNFSGKSPIKNMEDAKEKLDFYCEGAAVCPFHFHIKGEQGGSVTWWTTPLWVMWWSTCVRVNVSMKQ